MTRFMKLYEGRLEEAISDNGDETAARFLPRSQNKLSPMLSRTTSRVDRNFPVRPSNAITPLRYLQAVSKAVNNARVNRP